MHPYPRRKPVIVLALVAASIMLCVALGLPRAALAHELGWSYVFLDIEDDGIRGHLELPIDQLSLVLNLDADGDGAIVDADIESRWPLITNHAMSILRLGSGTEDYPLTVTGRDVLDIEIAKYAIIRFAAATPTPVPATLEAEFTPFEGAATEHRGGLVIENNVLSGEVGNHSEIKFVFSPREKSGTVNLLGESVWVKGWRFVVEGVWHIWIGIDHVLFLVTLLLVAVMALKDKRWEPVPDFRRAFINLFAIVTLFTIAHSITLALALKGWVTLPSRLVESIIALSVIVVAVNNVRPVISHQIRWLVFLFGLFHGLGFANVLMDLLVTRESKITALIGFNIGVEIGQLAIVAVLFPLLYLIRNNAYYRRGVLPGVSSIVSLIGLWWFVSRALDIESYISSF